MDLDGIPRTENVHYDPCWILPLLGNNAIGAVKDSTISHVFG